MFGGVSAFSAKIILAEEYSKVLLPILTILAGMWIVPVVYPKQLFNKFSESKKIMDIIEPLSVAFLILLVTAYLVDGSFNPFLYFRF